MSYLELLVSTLPSLLASIPGLLAWLTGIVLAVLMLRRGGGKAEKLLLIGCSLLFVARIVRPFLTGLALWLVAEHGMTRASVVGLTLSLPIGILDMAGIICLVFAFWLRWRTKVIKQ